MTGDNKQEIKRQHYERIAQLMKTTTVYNDTTFHVLDEATMHVVDHFNPVGNPAHPQGHDHVLIVGMAHFGKEVEDPSENVNALTFYVEGDTHALSHTLAECMRRDKRFAHVICHAMECFALGK